MLSSSAAMADVNDACENVVGGTITVTIINAGNAAATILLHSARALTDGHSVTNEHPNHYAPNTHADENHADIQSTRWVRNELMLPCIRGYAFSVTADVAGVTGRAPPYRPSAPRRGCSISPL